MIEERFSNGSLLYIPVLHNERAIGVLRLLHGEKHGFDQNQILISRSVRDDIQERISELKGLDDLVQLPSRRVKGRRKTIQVYGVVTRPLQEDSESPPIMN